MTVGELKEILRGERDNEEIRIKISGDAGDFDIVAVSVSRTAAALDPAPVVLIARERSGSGR